MSDRYLPVDPMIEEIMVPVWGAAQGAVDGLNKHKLVMPPGGAVAVSTEGQLLLAQPLTPDGAFLVPNAIRMALTDDKPPYNPDWFISRRTREETTVGFCMRGGSYDPHIINLLLGLTSAQLNEEHWKRPGGRYVEVG